MPKTTKSIYLIIIILIPLFVFSQNEEISNKKIIIRDSSFEKDSIRARELYTNAS